MCDTATKTCISYQLVFGAYFILLVCCVLDFPLKCTEYSKILIQPDRHSHSVTWMRKGDPHT